MAFLGPIRVIYSGPQEDEARLVSMARGRLGYLEAMRLGYPESPVSNHISLPGGGTISVQMAGGYATARITASVPAQRRDGRQGEQRKTRTVRRFVDTPCFVLCRTPTSRPLRIDIGKGADGKYASMSGKLLYAGAGHIEGVFVASGVAVFASPMKTVLLDQMEPEMVAGLMLPPASVWFAPAGEVVGRMISAGTTGFVESRLRSSLGSTTDFAPPTKFGEKPGTVPDALEHNWCPGARVVGVVQIDTDSVAVVTGTDSLTWDVRETALVDGFVPLQYLINAGLMSHLLYRSQLHFTANPTTYLDKFTYYHVGDGGSPRSYSGVSIDSTSGAVSNYTIGLTVDGNSSRYWYHEGDGIVMASNGNGTGTWWYPNEAPFDVTAALAAAHARIAAYRESRRYLYPAFTGAAYMDRNRYGAWNYTDHVVNGPSPSQGVITGEQLAGWRYGPEIQYVSPSYDQITTYNAVTGALERKQRFVRDAAAPVFITSVSPRAVGVGYPITSRRHTSGGTDANRLVGTGTTESGAVVALTRGNLPIRATCPVDGALMVYSAAADGTGAAITLNSLDGAVLLSSENFPALKALLDSPYPVGTYTGPTGYCSLVPAMLPALASETEEPI